MGLYYAVLAFNLGLTFWIGEWHMGVSGVLMCLSITVWLALRLTGSIRPLESYAMERSTRPGSNQGRDFV